jgi:hypothetical protein
MLIQWAQSQLLMPHDFEKMQTGAEVLERDPRGIKVLKLENGNILKVFRIRSRISSTYLYSYARRFCRNARRLQKLAIPTMEIKQLFHFSDSNNTAVLYEPLPGETLRKLAYAGELSDEACAELGQFIAKLHDDGVHFRSLHLGNIVLTPFRELGLIDISDMSIYPWRLLASTRIRNFRHLWRYPKDFQMLGEKKWLIVERAYFDHCQLPNSGAQKIKRELQLLARPKL